MKEEALKLADELDGFCLAEETNFVSADSADMIRKLVAELKDAEDTIGRLMLEINRLHNEAV